jgi:hypothetical protein
MSEGVREQVVRTLRELEFLPRGHAKIHQKPYLEYFDTIP